jgi:hypothetical protein
LPSGHIQADPFRGLVEVIVSGDSVAANLPRFPSLAAFVRRPGSHRACCQLSDGAGIRNPSHKRTHAPQQKVPLFDHLVGLGQQCR